MKLCFATRNAGKVREVAQLLGNRVETVNLADIGCLEEIPEEGATLRANALQKAQYVTQKYGIACFADDTGLEVDVLDGAPGAYSARYAGKQKNDEDNMRLLLHNLAEHTDRRARFVTSIALCLHRDKRLFEGILWGTIATEKRGKNGFGYDPLFIPAGSDVSLAQMALEGKNRISHRRKAIDGLVQFLRTLKK